MSKVYLLSDNGHDLSNISKFGELVVLRVGNYPIFNSGLVLTELKCGLVDFKDEDYLVMSGSPFVASLATAILFLKGEKKLNILLFDAKRREYAPRTISSCQLNDDKYEWQVCRTTNGYEYDGSRPLATFDDYEEAVKYLYKDNSNNEQKLGIISVKVN